MNLLLLLLLFPADAVVDVTRYGAKPDDSRDDTAAIQKAITDNVGTGRVLYFPAGTYDLSDTLVAKNRDGVWRAHLTLQGAGRDKTILRMKSAKPLLMTGSHWEKGDALDGGGNKAFRNNIFDMTILGDIDWAVSNQGAIENVTIRGTLSLRRRIPGPGLIKNVSATSIDIGDIQYGITLENVTANVRNTENVLHARHLTGEVVVTKPNGVLTLVDSNAKVECAGTAITNTAHLLPVEEAPEYWNANLADWRPVGPRREGERDDTPAIQRALDAGQSTVYFPNNRVYFLSDTVVIRDAVRQVLGMGSEISLGAAREPFSHREHPHPLIRIESAVSIENLFFNAQYPGEVIFENTSSGTVVIKHCAGWVGAEGYRRSYRNTGTGKLFIEDVFLPGWEFNRQSVWARQFNPENPDGDGTTPQVANIGGRLWILGFKTEGPAPFIATTAGGVTELLGAYNYISATQAPQVPTNAVPYLVTDSRAALTFVTDNFRDNDYATYIRAIQAGQSHDWHGADLQPRNGHTGDRSFIAPLVISP